MPFKNYGVEWKRSKGFWGRSGRSKPVNFERQIGVYVLQCGEEVVYVGQTGLGPNAGIGERIWLHSKDEKKGDWDTFCWFGLRPVGRNGELDEARTITMETAAAIKDIEALLIYLLDPRLNNRRGRHRHIIEFDQCERPW